MKFQKLQNDYNRYIIYLKFHAPKISATGANAPPLPLKTLLILLHQPSKDIASGGRLIARGRI